MREKKKNTRLEPPSHDSEICTSIDSTVQDIAHSCKIHRETGKCQGKLFI